MSVLHKESSKLLAPPRNTKDRKHLQSTQTSVDRHNSQTKHQALSKGQHNTNQDSSRARLQHSNNPPLSPSPNRVTARSSQPTQPAAKDRRAEPHLSQPGVIVNANIRDAIVPCNGHFGVLRVRELHLCECEHFILRNKSRGEQSSPDTCELKKPHESMFAVNTGVSGSSRCGARVIPVL